MVKYCLRPCFTFIWLGQRTNHFFMAGSGGDKYYDKHFIYIISFNHCNEDPIKGTEEQKANKASKVTLL